MVEVEMYIPGTGTHETNLLNKSSSKGWDLVGLVAGAIDVDSTAALAVAALRVAVDHSAPALLR